MKVITADETGLLKLVDVTKNNYTSHGTQSRSLSVINTCWLRINHSFAILRSNGCVEEWKVRSKGLLCTRKIQTDIINGMGIIAMNEHTVICYSSTGAVLTVDLSSSDSKEWNELTVKGPIDCVTYNSIQKTIACGGNDNDLKVLDATTGAKVWAAKNVPHDSVRLAVPVWVSSIAFLPTAGDVCGPDSLSDGNLIATGTAYKHMRLYDIRTRRQPVASYEIGDFRVTRILPTSVWDATACSGSGSAAVHIADASGGLQSRDLRTGKTLTLYAGSAGSIRDMACNPAGDRLATVSLDRYLRVYQPGKKKLLHEAYLKNRLNACLIIEDGENNRKEDIYEGTEESDDRLETYMDSDDEAGSSEDGSDDDNECSESEEVELEEIDSSPEDYEGEQDEDSAGDDSEDSSEEEDDEGEDEEGDDDDSEGDSDSAPEVTPARSMDNKKSASSKTSQPPKKRKLR